MMEIFGCTRYLKVMFRPVFCLVAILFALTGCHGNSAFRNDLIAIYGSQSEAAAIEQGQFGAVPIALLSEQEIMCLPDFDPAKPNVSVEVVSINGVRGWAPKQELLKFPINLCK